MTANPLTDLDLEAFCRRKLLVLTSWEKDVIFSLDDTVLSVWREKSADTPSAPTDTASKPIPLENGRAVSDFFSVLAIKQNARHGRQAAKGSKR